MQEATRKKDEKKKEVLGEQNLGIGDCCGFWGGFFVVLFCFFNYNFIGDFHLKPDLKKKKNPDLFLV